MKVTFTFHHEGKPHEPTQLVHGATFDVKDEDYGLGKEEFAARYLHPVVEKYLLHHNERMKLAKQG
jgi:hypothetical protein